MTDAASIKSSSRAEGRTQLLLICGFTASFFVAAATSRFGFIQFGDFASLTFLSLAASVTLYFFLSTAAEIKTKSYTVGGAGALFLLIFSAGVHVINAGPRYDDVTVKGTVRLDEAPAEGFQRHQLRISLIPQRREVPTTNGIDAAEFWVQIPARRDSAGIRGPVEKLSFEYPCYVSKGVPLASDQIDSFNHLTLAEVTLIRNPRPLDADGCG